MHHLTFWYQTSNQKYISANHWNDSEYNFVHIINIHANHFSSLRSIWEKFHNAAIKQNQKSEPKYVSEMLWFVQRYISNIYIFLIKQQLNRTKSKNQNMLRIYYELYKDTYLIDIFSQLFNFIYNMQHRLFKTFWSQTSNQKYISTNHWNDSEYIFVNIINVHANNISSLSSIMQQFNKRDLLSLMI